MTPAPLGFEPLGRRAGLVDLSPVGLAFRAGEQLRLLVSAQNLFGTMMPGNREYTPAQQRATRRPHRRIARFVSPVARQGGVSNRGESSEMIGPSETLGCERSRWQGG
jgi:hypothetical protein